VRLIIGLHVWGPTPTAQEGVFSLGDKGSPGMDPRVNHEGQGGGSCLLCQFLSRLETTSIELKPSESILNSKTKPA
jgi:hypothetical protein